MTDHPSAAAVIAIRLAQELQHVQAIRDSVWLTEEVVDALDRLLDEEAIAPGRQLREGR